MKTFGIVSKLKMNLKRKATDLVLPLSGNGLGEGESGEFELPFGRRLEGSIVQHHRPPISILGQSCSDLLVEALANDGASHEGHGHGHRRTISRRRPH